MSYARPRMSAYEREQQRIARIKARNEDRARRLLNARVRIYGRDTTIHQQQVKDREDRKRVERDRDIYFDQKRLEEAKILEQMERERADRAREERIELSRYNEQQRLLKEERDREEREFRRGDGGERIRQERDKSLFLTFHGEDPDKQARRKEQQRQQAQWIIEQMRAKEQARKAEAELDKQYVNFTETVGGTCEAAEREKTSATTLRNVDIRDYNRQLAIAKSRKERDRRSAEEKAAQEEINAMHQSKLLNEDQSTTYHATNPNRRLRYHFKGFSEEEQAAIIAEQARQMREKQDSRARDASAAQEDDDRQEGFRRQLVLMERERINQDARNRREVRAYNEYQAAEKQARDANFKKNVYRNPVSAAFFDQFGRSLS